VRRFFEFRKRWRDEEGFALVLVLWIAGLLAVLSGGLAASVRTQIRVAANVIESAKAEALADGGVTLAVMDLVAARRSRTHPRRFPVDGHPVACRGPNRAVIIVSVTDEASRVDVNTAGIPLMQALLTGVGERPEKAARVAEAIFDFRDADDERKPNGAEGAEYRAAGLGWLPKNAPLQSVSELNQVYGVTPGLRARLRPFLSTHSGLPGFDVSLASPALITRLRAGLSGLSSSSGSFPELYATVPLPAMFVSSSEQKTFTVRSTARLPSRAVFVREAVVDLGPRQSPRQDYVRWTRGTDLQPTEEEITSAAHLSLC
jgi:general secretion pathway protein K